MSTHRGEILAACALEPAAAPGDHEADFIARFFDETVSAIRRDFGVPESRSPLPGMSQTAVQFAVERQRAGVAVTRIPAIFAAISQALGKVGGRYELTITADEYKLLDSCFDSGVASSIETYWQRDRERENDLITEHFGFMAHELRNALGNAKMALRVLRSGDLTLDGRTADVLARNLVRMEGLIAQCLGGVRLEAAGPPTLLPVQVAEVLRDLEASALPERGVQLVLEANDDLLIAADEMLLASAVGNLLHNAVKFSPPRSTVTLRAYEQGGLVLIEVEDECGGLGEHTADELFRPYMKRQRGNPTGSGLGLSIAKRAVEAMRGTLNVVDHPGQGCAFSIAFPRCAI